jgi:hypothetical protein
VSWRVELSKEEREELVRLKATPQKSELLGRCCGCGKGIPQGYVPYVTKHASVLMGLVKTLLPIDSWCRDCGKEAHTKGILPKYRVESMSYEAYKRSLDIQLLRVVPDEPEPTKESVEVDKVNPKELALKMMTVMSTTEGYGSKKIAKLAGIEYSDLLKAILQKLAEAKKVVFEDGRWRRL